MVQRLLEGSAFFRPGSYLSKLSDLLYMIKVEKSLKQFLNLKIASSLHRIFPLYPDGDRVFANN